MNRIIIFFTICDTISILKLYSPAIITFCSKDYIRGGQFPSTQGVAPSGDWEFPSAEGWQAEPDGEFPSMEGWHR